MLFGITLALALSAVPSPAPSHLIMPACEFQDAYQFAATDCSIELSNTGDAPIRISNAVPTIAGDSISPTSLTIAPRSVAYVQAHVMLRNEVGRTRRLFNLTTDEPGQTLRHAEVNGFVSTILDEPRPKVDFDVVNIPGKLPEQSVTLSSREVADFHIESISSAPDYLDVEIGSDKKSVRARLKKDAPWGLHEADSIKLKVNAAQQPDVWIAVRVDVHGEVIPDSNPFALGLLRKGGANEALLRLNSRSGKDFKLGKLNVERVKGTAEALPCTPVAKGCQLVRFRLAEDQPTGSVGGVVTVDLPEFGQHLPIYIWGMLVGANTEVKDLNEELKKAAEAQAAKGIGVESLATSGTSGKIDLKQALKGEVQAASEPPPSGEGPLLKWTVAHESLLHGYAIYRSTSEAGPFVRINKETIFVKSQADDGASYQWRDTSAQHGITYWYYIGLLNKDGTKQQLTGAQKIIAK